MRAARGAPPAAACDLVITCVIVNVCKCNGQSPGDRSYSRELHTYTDFRISEPDCQIRANSTSAAPLGLFAPAPTRAQSPQSMTLRSLPICRCRMRRPAQPTTQERGYLSRCTSDGRRTREEGRRLVQRCACELCQRACPMNDAVSSCRCTCPAPPDYTPCDHPHGR